MRMMDGLAAGAVIGGLAAAVWTVGRTLVDMLTRR
jgi:hypothetical protein